MTGHGLVAEKIKEIIDEMQRTGLWTNHPPHEAMNNQRVKANDESAFCNWLQFVYLPGRQRETIRPKQLEEGAYIAPQAARFLQSDPRSNRLLQLLIELDSL